MPSSWTTPECRPSSRIDQCRDQRAVGTSRPPASFCRPWHRPCGQPAKGRGRVRPPRNRAANRPGGRRGAAQVRPSCPSARRAALPAVRVRQHARARRRRRNSAPGRRLRRRRKQPHLPPRQRLLRRPCPLPQRALPVHVGLPRLPRARRRPLRRPPRRPGPLRQLRQALPPRRMVYPRALRAVPRRWAPLRHPGVLRPGAPALLPGIRLPRRPPLSRPRRLRAGLTGAPRSLRNRPAPRHTATGPW